jgi:hypothetical protein
MKTNIIRHGIALILLLHVVFNPAPTFAASYVIGLSPNDNEPQRTEVFQNVLTFILETTDPGDSVTICDALNQKLVASFAIPEGRLFQANAKARAQRLAGPLAELKRFIVADRSYPPALKNAVGLPQFLDFAATQLRRPGESLRVVVLASPLYVDSHGDGACTLLSAFPSDAHLAATPDQSVFGCALKKSILSGMTVHVAYLNTSFLNEYHQERICRFWVLYCQQTSGVLSTWCADPVLAFRRAKENVQQQCIEAHLDLADRTIELRQVSRRSALATRTVTNEVGRLNATTVVPNVTTIATVSRPSSDSQPSQVQPRELSVTSITPATGDSLSRDNRQAEAGQGAAAFESAKLAAAFPVKPAAKNFGVGIAWSASVDLDVWVEPCPGAAELSFHHTNSPQGRYLHDWRSGNLGLDYEYVLLNPDQDVDLSQTGCWINYYAGNVTPVRGIVVVHYNGRAYQGEFTISAPSGNKAADRGRRQTRRWWVKIDLAAIVRSGQAIQTANASR